MLTQSNPQSGRGRQPSGTLLPRLVGQDLKVQLADGETRTYVNLDMAASTPAMEPVADAVIQFLPWYSSVHRGAGFASQVATRTYEAAREAVAEFVGARSTDTVIFVRNTTEAINLLAHCLVLRPDHAVLSTIVEHHANMLPWRRLARVELLDAPSSPDQLLDDMRRALEDRHRPVGVVAITGASNVTGEVFPIAEIGRLAHEHGALLAVDAAQLAPHRAIDMVAMGIDFLALSGHKMYAPFGGGALIAPSAVLTDAEPMLAGGGAVTYVTTDDVQWAQLPDRHEAGSPNVIGAVALGAACTVLGRTGMGPISAHERRLLAYLDGQIDDLPHLHRLRLWDGPDIDRLGVSTFTVDGMHHALVASVLSAEYGGRCAPRLLLRAPVHHAPARRQHRGRAHHPRAAPPRRAPRDPGRHQGIVRDRHDGRAHRSSRDRAARDQHPGTPGRVRRGSPHRRLRAGRRPATLSRIRLPPAARGDDDPVRVRAVLTGQAGCASSRASASASVTGARQTKPLQT